MTADLAPACPMSPIVVAAPVISGYFAVDDQFVYAFTTDDTLARYPHSGGPGTTVVGGINTSIDGYLLVDSAKLYWIVYDAPRVIVAAAKSGGATTVINQPSIDIPIGHLIQDADHLYWAGDVDIAVADKTGGVRRLTALRQDVWDMVVDDQFVYWVAEVLDGTTQSVLMRVAKTGGDPVEVARWMGYPGYLAIDGASIYATGSAVQRIDKASGAVTTIYPRAGSPGDPDSFNAIAADGTWLYISTFSSTTKLDYMVRTRSDGSEAQVLDDPGTSHIVLEGDSVYYAGMTDIGGTLHPAIKRICR